MNTSVRLVSRVIGNPPDAKVKHYRGVPPLAGDKDMRVEMESPALMFIEKTPAGVFLYRYTFDGRVVGDTWHATVNDAKEQARYEYGDLISPWKSVPADIKDVIAFGLQGK